MALKHTLCVLFVVLLVATVIVVPQNAYATSWSIKKYIKSYKVVNWDTPTTNIYVYLSTKKGHPIYYIGTRIPSDNKLIIYTGIAVEKYTRDDIDDDNVLSFATGAVYYKYGNPNICSGDYCEQFYVQDVYKIYEASRSSMVTNYIVDFTVEASSELEAKSKIEAKLGELVSYGFEVTSVITIKASALYKVEVKVIYYTYYIGSEYIADLNYAAYSDTSYRYFTKRYDISVATPIATIIDNFSYN